MVRRSRYLFEITGPSYGNDYYNGFDCKKCNNTTLSKREMRHFQEHQLQHIRVTHLEPRLTMSGKKVTQKYRVFQKGCYFEVLLGTPHFGTLSKNKKCTLSSTVFKKLWITLPRILSTFKLFLSANVTDRLFSCEKFDVNRNVRRKSNYELENIQIRENLLPREDSDF